MTDSVRDSIVVNADPDRIMDVIADFEVYPEWQEEVTEVEILETDADGWGTKVRFRVDAKLGSAEYVLDYDYTDTTMSWELDASDDLRENRGAYVLSDRGDGTTEVTYELEVETNIRVPKLIRNQVAKRIVHAALNGMKKRVEAQGS